MVERLERHHAVAHGERRRSRSTSGITSRSRIESGAQRLYVDGVVQAATGSYTGALATNNLPLYVGTDWNFLSRAFDGYIDEVRVVADALSQGRDSDAARRDAAVREHARFTITHNAFGIHCVAETVTVDVVDAITGTPLLNYNAPVQLDTQGAAATARGRSSRARGAFSDGTADDGIATYTWPLGQSQATFTLYYPQGPPSIDVDVFQTTNTGIRDDDAEGVLVFSPSGFSVTAAELLDPSGGVAPFASSQVGRHELRSAPRGVRPNAERSRVRHHRGIRGHQEPQVLVAARRPRDGNAHRHHRCRRHGGHRSRREPAQAVTFVGGKAVVTAKYKDVGRIRIAMKDDTTVNAELPAGITGATTNFVVRPYDFQLERHRERGGHRRESAGSRRVRRRILGRRRAVSRDGHGARRGGRCDAEFRPRSDSRRRAPRDAARRAGRRREPRRSGLRSVSGPSPNGVATGTDFTWSEVGIMQAVPGIDDGDYLTAGDVTGPASERIGRFVPSHFVVALNSPLFETACSAGGFTYQGQAFDYVNAPVITATAVAVSGTPTTNYTGLVLQARQHDADGPQLLEPGSRARHVGPARDGGRPRDRERRRRRWRH